MILHTCGDSFTYGYTLEDRNKSWPFILSKKLNCFDVKNYALVGGSNSRTVRKLYNANLQKNDVVVVAWSITDRFELGVSKNSDIQKNKHYIVEKNKEYELGNELEVDDKIITKRFFSQMTDRCIDKRLKELSLFLYKDFYNQEWFDEIFRTQYWSLINLFERKQVNWMMFNTWTSSTLTNPIWIDELNIEKYIFGTNDNATNFLMNNYGKKVINEHLYWNNLGHEKISNILHEFYKKIYG